jgi:cation diffusion facilitator CzcD-associated flavoprotein CzcO
VSPVYDFLETNIPHTLMNYTDKAFPEEASLFPPHKVVLEYIQDYAKDMEQHISYQTQVISVTKTQSNGRRCWEVESKDLRTKVVVKREYDAIAVASGHYNDPFVPDITGLQHFNERYPGSISHSKFYRRPDHFKDKVILPLTYALRAVNRSWHWLIRVRRN